jgi:hypothetical protein
VDPDVKVERRKVAAREQLDPLRLVEGAGAGKKRLEMVLILRDGANATTIYKFEEGSSAERRTIAQAEQLREPAPRRSTLVRLDLDVPHLRPVLQVVGGHPDLLFLHDPLLVEVGLTAVDEDEGINLAVVPGKSIL